MNIYDYDRDPIKREVDALELSALESLFMNKPLSNNLTKLRVCIRGDACREILRVALKNGLPKLDGTKRLEFDVGYI
jgi:hypothetical protein